MIGFDIQFFGAKRGSGNGSFGSDGSSITYTSKSGVTQTLKQVGKNVYNADENTLVAENKNIRDIQRYAQNNGLSYTTRSAKEEQKRAQQRIEENSNKPDYSLGYGLGPGGSISREARRVSRHYTRKSSWKPRGK